MSKLNLFDRRFLKREGLPYYGRSWGAGMPTVSWKLLPVGRLNVKMTELTLVKR